MAGKEIISITRAIPPKKSEQWHYRIHPYFTKQSANVVRAYIDNYSRKGEMVLDPFCGSGVTAIEALSSKRRTAAVDIEPLACFITRETCIAPVDLRKFQHEFVELEKRLKQDIKFVRNASGKEIENYRITNWYPKKVRLPSNADCEYVDELFGKKELIILSSILAQIQNIRDKETRSLFLFTFSGILHRASRTYSVDLNKAGGGDSGIFKVFRYWIPPHPDTRDIWEMFRTRFRIVLRGKERCNKIIGDFFKEGETFTVHQESATRISQFIKEKSVDYIYTDPPYGAHIAYVDLSTMWDAWLGFKISEKDRKLEVIENGDVGHTKEEYIDLLSESIVEMYKVLKKNAWLSMVFHHKEARLWYSIVDAARSAGFEYVNTVAQPISKQTFHKVKNPLKVLGEQLIVNFRKSKATFPVSAQQPLGVKQLIYNAAEREILKSGGATLEDIMRAVVPELFEANLIDKVALKSVNDVSELLAQEFELGLDDRWHIKKENQKKIGQYIEPRLRIRYYMISLLRREKKANLDKIVTTLLPLLINGHRPTREEIIDVLEEVGVSRDGKTWQLKDPNQIAVQHELYLETATGVKQTVPETTVHNQMLFRLAVLCKKFKFSPYIAKRERSTADELFSGLDLLSDLPLKISNEANRKKIEQIDCIWFHKDTPVYAFEVEETTSIRTALERFHGLLEEYSGIGIERRLVIVTPKRRVRKLTQELTESAYIGHPMFMEQKIAYMYNEDFIKFYGYLASEKDVSIQELDRLFTSPGVLGK